MTLSPIAISIRPKPTAMPIAPVDQMAAAVDVPLTCEESLSIAPPPMKPMPVIMPAKTFACASCDSNKDTDKIVNEHAAIDTIGKVRSPAERSLDSRSQAIRRGSTSAVSNCNRFLTLKSADFPPELKARLIRQAPLIALNRCSLL